MVDLVTFWGKNNCAFQIHKIFHDEGFERIKRQNSKQLICTVIMKDSTLCAW